MKKKYVLSLLVSLVCSILFSQNESILNELNSRYSKNQKKPDTTTVAKVTVDTVFINLTDSIDLINPGEVIQVEETDSSLFKAEVIFPEKQIPTQKYAKEEEWKKKFLITNNVSYKKKHVIDTTYKIFGWHPYWMGNAYESYNFSLLSMVAYFSYELNPLTGGYKTIHNWEKTKLVDSAKANGCKVLLTVTNFGSTNNKRFLNNPKAQSNFITTLINLLKLRNADGVNIDFEGVGNSDRDELNNFLINLSTKLKTQNSNYLITVAIPVFDFREVYDIPSIESHVDKFIVMGYEFHGVNSKVAGPIAPVVSGKLWSPLNIEESVNKHLVSGIPAKKLIVAFPYYGVEWQTHDLRFPSNVKKFEKYHTYRSIKRITRNYTGTPDENSMSQYYVYSDANNNFRQIWYDDSLSLAMKYDWIKEKQIGGVGIWALGYDNGHDELWKLLANKFAYDSDQLLALKKKNRRLSLRRMMSLIMRAIRNPRSLLTNPRPMMGIFGALFGVSLMGFFIIYRYGYRFSRMFKIALKGTFTIFVILAVALIFLIFRFIQAKEVLYLIGGIIFGLILFYIFSRRFISEKDLP